MPYPDLSTVPSVTLAFTAGACATLCSLLVEQKIHGGEEALDGPLAVEFHNLSAAGAHLLRTRGEFSEDVERALAVNSVELHRVFPSETRKGKDPPSKRVLDRLLAHINCETIS